MKRFLTIMGLTTAFFLMLTVSIRQSVAHHEDKAKIYATQKLYDEALQEYSQAATHIRILKSTIRLFGEFNAFLAGLGILLMGGGLMLKKTNPASRLLRVKITKDFHP